jgi:hypothetical protein
MLRQVIEIFVPGITSDPLVAFEALILVLVFLVALLRPRSGAAWFGKLEHGVAVLAIRRRLSIVFVIALALLMRLALLPLAPIPAPNVADEFSYLLAADTFLSGRLANPTHPMWQHFEAVHIIHQPSYASSHPPAQALVLAAGRVLGGHAWIGVWLSAAAMCGAICWMLQGYLPPRWALVGGVLAVFRLCTFSYWASNYWGGAVPAIGGALVLGALPRIKQHQRTGDALLMGLGLAVLASSRPYEGFLLGISSAVVLVAWCPGIFWPKRRIFCRRALIPMLLVLVLAGAGLAYYNWRVTGNALRFPSQVSRNTYGGVPVFLWQAAPPEQSYRHKALRDFFVLTEAQAYHNARSNFRSLVRMEAYRVRTLLSFYFSPALLLPLIFFPLVLLESRVRIPVMVAAVALLGAVQVTWFFPHYVAPVTCAFYAIFLQCLRHLRAASRYGCRSGLMLARIIPLVCLLTVPVAAASKALHIPPQMGSQLPWYFTWHEPLSSGERRQRILDEFGKQGGRHLVLVRYGLDRPSSRRFVYNDANIDRAQVVWAWEMGSQQDNELIRYFADRKVWLLLPDQEPPLLLPYPVEENN